MTLISNQKTAKTRTGKRNYTGKKYPSFSRFKPLESQTDFEHMSFDLWGVSEEYLRSAFITRKKQKEYLNSITPTLSDKELLKEEKLRHELNRRYNQLVQLQRKKQEVAPEKFRELFAEAEEYWPINFHIIRKLAPYYPNKK